MAIRYFFLLLVIAGLVHSTLMVPMVTIGLVRAMVRLAPTACSSMIRATAAGTSTSHVLMDVPSVPSVNKHRRLMRLVVRTETDSVHGKIVFVYQSNGQFYQATFQPTII